MLSAEQLAVERAGAQHGQQVRRHADGAHPLGFAIARQVRIRANGDRQLFETAMPRLDVEVLGRGRTSLP